MGSPRHPGQFCWRDNLRAITQFSRPHQPACHITPPSTLAPIFISMGGRKADQVVLLDRFSVQRGRLERSFSKAVRELEHLRKNRLVEVAEPAQVIVAQPVPERITDFGVEPRPAVLPSLVMSPAIQCDSR